MIVKC